jgi:hypothetical protein
MFGITEPGLRCEGARKLSKDMLLHSQVTPNAIWVPCKELLNPHVACANGCMIWLWAKSRPHHLDHTEDSRQNSLSCCTTPFFCLYGKVGWEEPGPLHGMQARVFFRCLVKV